MCSFVFHLVLVCSLALVGGKVVERIADEAPSFEEAKVDPTPDVPEKIERFEVGETPEDPTELSTETLTLEKPAQIAQEAEFNDDSARFEHQGGGMASDSKQPNLGGLGGFDIKGIGSGPAVKGKGGVGIGVGTGTHPGSGGSGWGFGGRGSGSRKAMFGSGGGTKQSERAVAARPELARPASTLQRQLGLDRLQDPLQGRHLHRAGPGRRPPGRRHRLGPVALLGRRTDARVERPLPEERSPPASASSSANQKPNGDLRMGGRDVRPRPGRHRPVRVLRHERRPKTCRPPPRPR